MKWTLLFTFRFWVYTCLFVSIYNLCVQSRAHRDLKRVWFSDDKVMVLVASLDRGTGDQVFWIARVFLKLSNPSRTLYWILNTFNYFSFSWNATLFRFGSCHILQWLYIIIITYYTFVCLHMYEVCFYS